MKRFGRLDERRHGVGKASAAGSWLFSGRALRRGHRSARTTASVVSKRRWRRSVNSVSLADLVQRRSAARWTGCSARAFAEAVVAKLEWRCKQQSFVADVLGTQAKVKLLYDRAVAAPRGIV